MWEMARVPPPLALVLLLAACSGRTAGTGPTTTPTPTPAPATTTTTEGTTTTVSTTTSSTLPPTTTTIDPVVEPILGLWESEFTGGRNPVTRLIQFFASGQMTYNVDLTGSAPTLGRFTFDGTHLEATIVLGAWGCETESGVYRAEVAGEALTLSAVDDACQSRRQTLAQTWTLRFPTGP